MYHQRNDSWKLLYRSIKEKGIESSALYEALYDYYTIYDDALLKWLASLYDKRYGGFYYSKSASEYSRVEFKGEQYDLLPDIESTYQALGLLVSSGLFPSYGDLPAVMKKQIKDFCISLLDKESGFFYHPQWPRAFVNANQSRRGRDLKWAIGLAELLDFKYPYPTAEELLSSESRTENTLLPDYLKSREAFLKYLDSFDWENSSYAAGNTLAAQSEMINAAGLADTAEEFLNGIQDEESGLWGVQRGYMAINSYLKISFLYNKMKKRIPNASRAALTVLNCATTAEVAETVCYQYNVWFSLNNISSNLIEHGAEVGLEDARALSRIIINNSQAAVRASKEKLLTFKKQDGSFSYTPKGACRTSQGMPVAVPDLNEGDVNASIICTSGITTHMFKALSLPMPPLFSEKAKNIFLEHIDL